MNSSFQVWAISPVSGVSGRQWPSRKRANKLGMGNTLDPFGLDAQFGDFGQFFFVIATLFAQVFQKNAPVLLVLPACSCNEQSSSERTRVYTAYSEANALQRAQRIGQCRP